MQYGQFLILNHATGMRRAKFFVYSFLAASFVALGRSTHLPVVRADDPDKGTQRIHVNSPNGGEIWSRGDKEKIRWRSMGFTGFNVRIDLLKGDSLARTIKEITPNDGKASWIVPQDIAPGTDYKVRIISLADPQLRDRSNGNFAIVGL